MHGSMQTTKQNRMMLARLSPFLAFIPPLFILYHLHAWSFEQTLHGRTFLLFFLWLITLEIMLGWERFEASGMDSFKSAKTLILIIALLLPTAYVIVANYYGVNETIENLALSLNVEKTSWPTVSVEYLVFTIFLALIILSLYGINGLQDFPISIFFSGTIGILFSMDNLYPYGKFTPLQILVPATVTVTANVFNLMGYTTKITFVNNALQGSYPYLKIINPQGTSVGLGIAWTCSGIESLLIYTVTILMFLRKMGTSLKKKVAFFIAGAIITYFINIFRIVNLFLIALEYGTKSQQWAQFHNFYGMLYSVTWIVCYPLIIIGGQTLWQKIKNQGKHRN